MFHYNFFYYRKTVLTPIVGSPATTPSTTTTPPVTQPTGQMRRYFEKKFRKLFTFYKINKEYFLCKHKVSHSI